MTEEFLVFRGERVWYSSRKRKIKCESDDGCLTIKDVKPEQVNREEAQTIIWADGNYLVEGNELWSNGTEYIIKINPSIDKYGFRKTVIAPSINFPTFFIYQFYP